MRFLAESPAVWLFVALGGAAGSALGLFLMRKPSPRRLLLSTAAISALLGALSAYPYWRAVNSVVGVGFLGSAASMVLTAMPPTAWLGTDSIWRTALRVTRRLTVYCAVGVTFALLGYLALRAGITLYVKLR